MGKIFFDIKNKYLIFKCPGCQLNHIVPTEGLNAVRWNKSLDLPSLNSDVKIESYTTDQLSLRCHFNIQEGKIEFSENSTHKMRGKKIGLLEVEP